MTKQEFLENLRRMLNRELNAEEVADNIRYYSNYIDEAMRGGKSEAQVLSELGDPRMIAKTILDVDQQKEEAGNACRETGTIYTEAEDGGYHAEEEYSEPHQGHFRKFELQTSGIKGWVILILIVLALLFIVGTVFKILWKLLPFIIIALMIMWIYNRITEK